MRSLALRTAYGSNVFFVVCTVILPSIRSSVALMNYRTAGDIKRKQTISVSFLNTIKDTFSWHVPHLRALSAPAASTLSGTPLCTWGKVWRSCSPLANLWDCPLWWTWALSSRLVPSAVQSHPLCFTQKTRDWLVRDE